jgi:hypothetical protein
MGTSKIRTWFQKVWDKAEYFFNKVDKAAKEYIPLVVNACEGLKKAVNNGTYDTAAILIDMMIPGDQSAYASLLKGFLLKNLPSIIANLQLADILAEIDNEDIEKQYEVVFNFLKNANNTALNHTLLGLATELSNVFADGKLTKAERHYLINAVYLKSIKNN